MFAQKGVTWTKCMKPQVGGNSCQKEHIGYAEKGKVVITMYPLSDKPETVTIEA